MVTLNNEWDNLLKGEFSKDYYLKLREFLKTEYMQYTVFPHMHNIFNALKFTSYTDVKAVILGQDPYHGDNQAHGLAFSVQEGVAVPPSLVNIFKELNSDLNIPISKSGCLENWAKNGVLLLNTVLTVRKAQANSHAGKGWEVFTDRVIELLNDRQSPLVFMLWGANARKKTSLITNKNHLVLETVHPSPLSAYNGFFGCKHFSLAQAFLQKHYGANGGIDWRLF